MTTPTPFSALLAQATIEGGRMRVQVPPDWLQGRTVFGGLQGALAVRAMRSQVPASLPLRTLQATLIAPSTGDLEIETQLLRTGKNATHVEARIFEKGTLCAIVIGVFGARLTSSVSLQPTQAPVGNEQAIAMPFIAGMMPNFIQHYDARLVRGAFPFTRSAVDESVYEVDLKDQQSPDEYSVVALTDFPPPLALAHLSRPAPGSTLTWMLELLSDDFSQLPRQGFRVDVKLLAARDGYTQQATMVWSKEGAPLALGHQTMLVFG